MEKRRFKVGLFIPCYIDQFYPQVGIATFELLKKLGSDIGYPLNQTCCGQPLANSGSEHEALSVYAAFVKNFRSFDYVVSPSGSCVYHVKKHYDILVGSGLVPDEDVNKVRNNIFELCEFITKILGVDDTRAYFPHKVGIHQSCHGLRGLGLGRESELAGSGERVGVVERLLSKVRGAEIIELSRKDECCGFGGTFSVFEPAISVSMGRSRVSDHIANGAEYITATDVSCLMHMEGIIRRESLDVKVVHIAEILNSSLNE